MAQNLIDYKIEIEGEPIAKERPRFRHKDHKGNALPYVITYSRQGDAEKSYRKSVLEFLTRNYPSRLFLIEGCPIAMGLKYIMSVRKNWPQYKIRDLQRGMTFYHFKKPDLDNLIKFTKDVLEGLCYKNDSQVAIMDPPPIKKYGMESKTIIQIRTLPEFESVT